MKTYRKCLPGLLAPTQLASQHTDCVAALGHERYKKLIVEVQDPVTVASQLRRALGATL